MVFKARPTDGFIPTNKISDQICSYCKNVKYIIIDKRARIYGFDVHSRQDILNHSYVAVRFNCRPSAGQCCK